MKGVLLELFNKIIPTHKAVSLRIDCFFLAKISDWSDEMSDIFKDMQAKVGCDYLSDLPSYKRKVWHEMKRLNPADYEERQLEDFSKYVFGMSYQTLKDVIKQQKGREEQRRKQGDRKSTRLNSSHRSLSRMPSSA